MSFKRILLDAGLITPTSLAVSPIALRTRLLLNHCSAIRSPTSHTPIRLATHTAPSSTAVQKSNVGLSNVSLAEALNKALSTGNIASTKSVASSLLRESGRFEGPISLEIFGLSKADVISIVDLLTSFRPADNLNVVEKILRRMHEQWNIPVDQTVHAMIVSNLLRSGELLTIFHWLSRMKDKPGGCIATIEQWHAFLHRCRTEDKVDMARKAVCAMRQAGCPPTEETFKCLTSVMFTSVSGAPKYTHVRDMVMHMHEEGVPFSKSLRDIIMAGYCDQNHPALAEYVRKLYDVSLHGEDSGVVETSGNTSEPQDQLLADVLKSDRSKALKLLKQYERQGFTPSESTLTAMAGSLTTVSALRFWQRRLGVEPTIDTWAALIQNIGPKSVYHATEAYKTALLDGHRPNLKILYPLIDLICKQHFGKPSEESIDTAIMFHREYVQVRSTFGLDDTQPPYRSEQATYRLLLRMLASFPSAEYFRVAIGLLEEMRGRGLEMESATVTEVIIFLMKHADSLESALKVYKATYKSKEGHVLLDAKSFASVLNTFCWLPFNGGIRTVQYLFDFIKDMREARIPISAHMYTIMLAYLGRLATSSAKDDVETRRKIAVVIRRLHDMITLDSSLVPDVALWNQLMDSYQRIGFFSETYDIWTTIFVSRSFDHTSVSIIMDACGYAGAVRSATDIYKQLHAIGFKFNRRNWMNWIECLCRLDMMDEAMKLVCMQMGRDGKSVTPDEEMIKVLLRFAAGNNRTGEVRTKLKMHLPDLWASLPRDI